MDTIKGKKFIKIFIANKMKKRNIKYENERVERNFPKNPNNISKEELHEHFDLNQDGKVTIEEYAEHINYHCDNPETLSDELDYERGFKYNEGGEVSLYFQQGSSDKEYHIQMEEEGGGYVVNFQYGRKGRALKSGTKTSQPVSLEQAEKTWSKEHPLKQNKK